MKQATRSLLTLVVIGAVGGAVALFAWWKSGTDPGTTTTTQARPLFPITHDQVTHLEITKGPATVVLDRAPDGWWITSPSRALADEREIERLTRLLAQTTSTIRYGEGAHPEIPADTLTGLDAPHSTVTFTAGAINGTIQIGAASDFNRDVYVRVSDSGGTPTTMTISPSSAKGIVRVVDELRDPTVLGADSARVLRMSVKPGVDAPSRFAFTFTRVPPDPRVPRYRQEARYVLEEPPLGAADSNTIRALFSSLATSPADTVVTLDHQGDLAAYGLVDPYVTITVTLAPRYPVGADETPSVREIRLSKPGDDGMMFVVHDKDSVVRKVSTLITGALFPSQEALVSKRLFDFSRDDVARVELELGEKSATVVLERYHPPGMDDPTWRMLAPEPGMAKPHLVSAIVLAFAGLVGEARVESGEAAKKPEVRARYGLDDSARRVTFIDAKGEPLGTLLLGRVDKGDVFVTAVDAAMILRVKEQLLGTLPASYTELLDTR